MLFLQTLGVVLLIAVLPVVLYALTKCGKDFDLYNWIVHSRSRLTLGIVLIVILSVLIVFVPEAADILAAVGFNSAKPAGLGLAIGGLLVAGIRGNENNG